MTTTATMEDEGIRIVLSPVQLAAVLTHEDVGQQATASNRLFGGLRLVGGVLELAGAGVLCVTPEPTMLTKAGCVVIGTHGVDNTVAAGRQIWTGRDSATLTEQGVSKLAQALGADEKSAANIGIAVDIAVPLVVAAAVGAARIAAVRAGRISLGAHEATSAGGRGGHTLLKHVGKTEQELRLRLAADLRIPSASSFTNLRTAEYAVSKVLTAHALQIRTWAQTASQGRLVLEGNIGSTVGLSVIRATGRAVKVDRVRVVLKMETYNNLPYYVLTAFPIP